MRLKIEEPHPTRLLTQLTPGDLYLSPCGELCMRITRNATGYYGVILTGPASGQFRDSDVTDHVYMPPPGLAVSVDD
jgi:hypothetical protein